MNSPAHHLKKSFLFDSHAVNQPTSMVNLNQGLPKRSSYNFKAENSTDYLKTSRDSYKYESSHSHKLNFMNSSISSRGSRNYGESFPTNEQGKQNNLQKKVNEIQLKLTSVQTQLLKLERQQNDKLMTVSLVKSIVLEQVNKKQKESQLQTTTTKSEIETLKSDLKNMVSIKEMDKNIIQMETNIKNAIVNVKNNLCQEVIESNEKQAKTRKKQLDELEKKFQESKDKITNELTIISDKLVNSGQKIFKPTNKLFFGKPIELKLSTTLCCKKEGIFELEPIGQEIEYRIDREGYLLDSSNCYLVNAFNQQIKISEDQIRMLEQIGLLR